MENRICFIATNREVSNFVEAHNLLEQMLGYVPELAYGVHGKPYLINEEGIHFNLSHTRGAIACAISDKSCGVDVESSKRIIRPVMAKRCFTPEELAWANDCPKRFIILWTRKEALLKRDGQSISQVLHHLDTMKRTDLRTFEIEDFILSFCGESCNFLLQKPRGINFVSAAFQEIHVGEKYVLY